MNTPTSIHIKAMRRSARLSQEAAGKLVYTTRRTWQRWEHGDQPIPLAAWELFCIKIERRANIRRAA